LWGTFETATNEAEFMHTHFQSNRARIFDRGGAELLGQGEDAEDAANPRFSELVINKVAECADVISDPDPPALVKLWLLDHPPVNDPIIFCRTYDPWSAGGTPKYVK
jgi:hypothetical protein